MDPTPLRLSSCIVQVMEREAVHDDGTIVRLTPREAELLAYLIQHADRPVSREELLRQVWGYAPTVMSRAADTAVRRLREKIEADATRPDHVLTVFGQGYRFMAASEPDTEPTLLGNLPLDSEPFVGREAELVELGVWLQEPGWWTLVGPPGTGKTRLAMRAARQARRWLPGGAWFCDLSVATDLGTAVRAIAGPMGIAGASHRSEVDALQRMVRSVAGRAQVLLVLDNCEQVAQPVLQIAEAVVQGAPEARILATSRQLLTSPLEHPVPVSPPDHDEAIELFEALAQRARPTFELDDRSRPVVGELVEQLERLPLALALAAGRVGALSPQALLERVSQRFKLLQDRRRDSTARHQTLRATLDWSWDTLDDRERRALSACAAFRGGFTVQAAEVVLGDTDVSEVLERLRQRSLLTRQGDRMGGYAFVREYATERLAADPQREAEVLERHWRWFAEWSEDADIEALRPEQHNLGVAATRALAAGDGPSAWKNGRAALRVLTLSGSMPEVATLAESLLQVPALPPEVEVELCLIGTGAYQRHGAWRDSQRLSDRAVQVADQAEEPALRAAALRGRGTHRRQSGDRQGAARDLKVATALARESGDDTVLGNALVSLGISLREIGDLDAARSCYRETIALGDKTLEASVIHALGNLALLERRESRFDQARELYEEALRRHRARGDRRAVGIALGGLANLELDVGDLARARRLYEDALVIAHEQSEAAQCATLEGNLGLLARTEGDLEQARQHARSSLALFEEVGDPRHVAIAIGNLGELDLLSGDLERAEDTLADACAQLAELHDPHARCELVIIWARVALALQRVEVARSRIDDALQAAHTSRNPVVVASALACRGLVELAEGSSADATLAEAAELLRDLNASAPVHAELDRLREAIASEPGTP